MTLNIDFIFSFIVLSILYWATILLIYRKYGKLNGEVQKYSKHVMGSLLLINIIAFLWTVTLFGMKSSSNTIAPMGTVKEIPSKLNIEEINKRSLQKQEETFEKEQEEDAKKSVEEFKEFLGE